MAPEIHFIRRQNCLKALLLVLLILFSRQLADLVDGSLFVNVSEHAHMLSRRQRHHLDFVGELVFYFLDHLADLAMRARAVNYRHTLAIVEVILLAELLLIILLS